MKKLDYFFPGCIANFGVVPLFLFWIFLFCPLFINLWARLFSVTHVLDDIFKLLARLCKSRKLTNSVTYVNANFLKASVFLILTTQSDQIAYGDTKDYWLGIGEHQEIDQKEAIKTFTVGNPEIISYKLQAGNKKLLIKGKKAGSTEILIWDKLGQKISYTVFVLGRVKQREMEEVAHQLQGQNLKIVPVGESLWVEGTIQKVDVFVLLQKIQQTQKNHLWIRADVDLEVKKWIIGDIYKSFLDLNIEYIKCWWEQAEIICQVPENIKNLEITKHFEETYGVRFLKNQFNSPRKNFRLKFKIIQIENTQGEEIKLGLDQITGQLGDLFNIGLKGMLFKNPFSINQKDYNFSTLASPEIILGVNEASKIEIGQEIAFETYSQNNGKSINWKFAGLKIEVKLIEISDYFKLEYESELTDGQVNSSIKGNKGKSTVAIEINSPLELFQIELKTVSKNSDQMPFLSKLPLIGEIFKSKGETETHKRINGVILLEEVRGKK